MKQLIVLLLICLNCSVIADEFNSEDNIQIVQMECFITFEPITDNLFNVLRNGLRVNIVDNKTVVEMLNNYTFRQTQCNL